MSGPIDAATFKPGIVRNLPAEDYHAMGGLSNSRISDLLKSPWHFYSRHLDPNRPLVKEKPSQRTGTVYHTAILEPGVFDDRHPVLPFPDRRSKAAKEWLDALRPDQTAITEQERVSALKAAESVRAIPDMAEALSCGYAEVSGFWIDTEFGLALRCRPDWVHEAPSGVVLIDVKTFADASPNAFARQAARMGYHRQAAFYSDGYQKASGRGVLAFLNVVVETEWPHAAAVYQLDPEALELGRRQYRHALRTYAECLTRDEWPAYQPGIALLSLPAYAMMEDEL